MSGHPPQRTAAEIYTTGPRNRWLIARTPLHARYPCSCVLGDRCANRCHCRGRTDHEHMPARCCSRAHPIAKTQEPT